MRRHCTHQDEGVLEWEFPLDFLFLMSCSLWHISIWVAHEYVWKLWVFFFSPLQWKLEALFLRYFSGFCKSSAHLLTLAYVDILLLLCCYLAAVLLVRPALCIQPTLLWRLWGGGVSQSDVLSTSVLLGSSLHVALVSGLWHQDSLSGTSRLPGLVSGTFQGKFLERRGPQSRSQC